jgi:hypothetical protein
MEGAARGRCWTLVAVCLTMFAQLLDITIVAVALPSIQHRFDASLTGLQLRRRLCAGARRLIRVAPSRTGTGGDCRS